MKKYVWILLLLIPFFWLAWGLTAKEQGNLAWGNIVTIMDEPSAVIFGLPGPGTYVGIRDGMALPAVRGGLKLIFTFADPSLGFRALTSRIFWTMDGYIFYGTVLIWLLGIFLLIFKRRKKSNS
jgi:hypothetical protein